MSVVVETTIGDITVDLYLKNRPNTCLNFLKLCKMKYYNLCVFHKVERNFIAQTGDPTSTGRGGESVFTHLYGDQAKYFEAELKPRMKHEKIGTLSMVNNGNNMNGSQFFLTLGENLTYLDEVHTVFGEVTEGFETLLKLNEAICDPNSRPFQDIRITHTVVLYDPYDDPSGLEIPDASPEPSKEMLETDYIAADEDIDDTKGMDAEEIEEKIKESEAKARATILEMVGDIPDADVKPPENVLFVCKLNPVTTSEDLELIFSRFGPIMSCEVIKDQKSGESLQYAFIEFEKEEDCENAYFKMDNVLIDDRRIHVDFSQSVSKLNWGKDKNFQKGKSNKTQNFDIKNKDKKSDGYELIFDNESNFDQPREKVGKSKKTASYKEPSYTGRNVKSSDKKRLQKSPDRRSYQNEFYSKDKHKPKQYSDSSFSEKALSKKKKKHRSRSPTMYHEKRSNSREYKLSKKRVRHDSSSNSSDSPVRQEKTSYNKEKQYTQYKDSRTSNNKLSYTSTRRDQSPSHSPIRSKAKPQVPTYLSRSQSKSSFQKRKSPTLLLSDSRSISPDFHSSKKNKPQSRSNRYDKIPGSHYSSQHRSHSKSPTSFNRNKDKSSKVCDYKKTKDHKKRSKSSSDSSDSSKDSESYRRKSKKKSSKSKKYYSQDKSTHKNSHKRLHRRSNS